MKYERAKEVVVSSPIGKKATCYAPVENVRIFILKPGMVPKNLKNKSKYDPNKNVQIWIARLGEKEFMPNHLRILMDLFIKRQQDPKKAKKLFDAMESVYKGGDPEDFKEELVSLKFNDELENSFTDLCLAQLFMIEQDVNYIFGKVNPPRAYLMGYIRMIMRGAEEIDKLLWSSIRHPPRMEFRKG
jgi:hypothetical protein